MKKLIILTGDLAAGKSTYAKILSKKFEIVAFTKDNIKESLGDNFGFSNREENLNLSKSTYSLFKLIFDSFIQVNQDLILEANFRSHEIDELYEICRKNDYELLTLHFKGNPEVLHKRYLNRTYNEARHEVHLINDFISYEGFVNYLNSLINKPIPGFVINVDADTFAYQKDEILLTRISSFLSR